MCLSPPAHTHDAFIPNLSKGRTLEERRSWIRCTTCSSPDDLHTLIERSDESSDTELVQVTPSHSLLRGARPYLEQHVARSSRKPAIGALTRHTPRLATALGRRYVGVMNWKLLERANVPDGTELLLYQREGHFMIRAAGTELMASHNYASEEALASLACQRVGQQRKVRFLVGGLGMGYTLAAALRQLRADAEVVVAELVPDVVRWNREHFGHLAAYPLEDARVRLHQGDVAQLLRRARNEYDAILLDVDNGPEGLTRIKNDWLYGRAGLYNAWRSLRPNGVLAVWSAGDDYAFSARLRAAGFEIEVCRARRRAAQPRSRHVIWLATPETEQEDDSAPLRPVGAEL